MFRGKSSEPPPPFAIQVLTPDYLIEGHIPRNMTWHSLVEIEIAPAHYQPTGTMTLPAGSAPLLHVQQNALVAIMPQDEACATDVLKGFGTQHLLKVTMLLNHYRFTGMAFATSDNISTLTYADAILMQDATIDCLIVGAQRKVWTAPLALIYTRKMLQGLFAI
ncbi:MAG: hypothetical protein H0X30_30630 [Anaerolineae bacterium]|nr:hypothetical protein [Anaerolineae bacterium]